MHQNRAYAILLLTTLFWGGNAVAGKLAVGHVSPFALTFLRWALALAILLPLAWKPLRRDWPLVKANLPLLMFLGMLGFTLFNASMYSALTFTSAVNVSIEQAAIPMAIIALNFCLFKVRATRLQLAGFVLSLLGVSLTASHGDLRRLTGLDINVGDLLMMLAVLAYGLYTVLLRFKPQIHWLSTIAVLAASALLASLPFLAWEHASGRLLLPDARGWAIVAYTALFPSILSQVFFIRGNELIGANRAGLFVNLVPIFGTLLSILILGETFQLHHAVAMALVFCGIWLAEYSGRRAAAAPARMRAPMDGS
ncbi:DMT family transporter [Chelativorans intermedius]|uniref:DMT family transporter n=1 Tax=Chelativorans intermedius TaxID=515947 RepID=A0ABV6DAF4_9HYPH|nr:DMT family transporter [Chelativorans intermedius]MCT8997978.1 DMT family transporter [Chelativorans intermedius]